MKSKVQGPRSKVGEASRVALTVLLAFALADRIAAAISAPVPVEDLAKRADTVVPAPRDHGGAGVTKDLLADRHDQSCVLRQRQETRWRQQTAIRIAPTKQRFGGDDAVGHHIEYRLIEDLELTLRKRRPKSRLPAVRHRVRDR